jgi:hypothetical protein
MIVARDRSVRLAVGQIERPGQPRAQCVRHLICPANILRRRGGSFRRRLHEEWHTRNASRSWR